MLKKKDKLFKTARILLQVGSFMPLMALGFSASIILILSVLLITLFVNSGAYSIGISLMLIVLFLICFFLFKEIYNKFFGKKVMNNRNLFVCLFISLIVSILIFGYETNSYEVSESLPFSFKMNNKELYFDIDNFKDIVVNSNSKYDNIKVYEEDLETGKMKIVLTYFNTSKPFYKNILKEDDKLYLEFDSTFIPNLDTPDSILRLGTDTIKNKTIYNYNMLKYPEISIYVNSDDMKKLEINKGL